MEVIICCKGQSLWGDLGGAVYVDFLDPAMQIGTIEYKHCSREVNGVAHELASFSYQNNISCT